LAVSPDRRHLELDRDTRAYAQPETIEHGVLCVAFRIARVHTGGHDGDLQVRVRRFRNVEVANAIELRERSPHLALRSIERQPTASLLQELMELAETAISAAPFVAFHDRAAVRA
jgi:hypothetical protein